MRRRRGWGQQEKPFTPQRGMFIKSSALRERQGLQPESREGHTREHQESQLEWLVSYTGCHIHILLYILLWMAETVQHLKRRGRTCSLLYVNYTSIKRVFLNVPRAGAGRREGGREGLRPPNTAASHHTRAPLCPREGQPR